MRLPVSRTDRARLPLPGEDREKLMALVQAVTWGAILFGVATLAAVLS